jgi:hypothetical protein
MVGFPKEKPGQRRKAHSGRGNAGQPGENMSQPEVTEKVNRGAESGNKEKGVSPSGVLVAQIVPAVQ